MSYMATAYGGMFEKPPSTRPSRHARRRTRTAERASALPRSRLDSSFSATALGNWETPQLPWGQRVGSRQGRRRKPIADSRGHLLPGLKRAGSSFPLTIEQMAVKKREQDLRTKFEALRGPLPRAAAGSPSPDLFMSMASQMAAAAQPRTRSSLGRSARPRTPDSIFEHKVVLSGTPGTPGVIDLKGPKLSLSAVNQNVTSARDNAVYVGGIPTLIDDDKIVSAISRAFGSVSAMARRRRKGSNDWAFLMFTVKSSVTRALDVGELRLSDGCVLRFKQPDHERMSNADMRSVSHIWRELIKKTPYGQHLETLRSKIEQSCPGGANSILRNFKRFREMSHSASMTITPEEFDSALRASNVHLSSKEVQQLFRDLDSDGNGLIDIKEFQCLITGRYDALGSADNSGSAIGSIGSKA